jgi:hypothetical protein
MDTVNGQRKGEQMAGEAFKDVSTFTVVVSSVTGRRLLRRPRYQ